MSWQKDLQAIARRRPEVEVHLEPHDHGFRDCRIALIRTTAEHRGEGLASAVLRELCKAADRHQVWLHLTPDPVGPQPQGRLHVRRGEALSKWALVSWYKRHGFERNRDLRITDAMSRPPGRCGHAC